MNEGLDKFGNFCIIGVINNLAFTVSGEPLTQMKAIFSWPLPMSPCGGIAR